MNKAKEKKIQWKKRHARVRRKIQGTSERPRISVYRSLNNIYVQLIDDLQGRTIASVSTLSKGFSKNGGKSTVESARKLGTLLSEAAKSKKIEKVVFDRSGYKYHGRIKALADAAREGGLKF